MKPATTNPRRKPTKRPASRPGATRRPRSPQPAAAETRRIGSRFTGRAAVMVLVSLVLVISYASSLKAWLQQREELASTRAQIADSERSIASLQKDKRRWEDPAYVEQQARERFGWVLPGEVGYRVIGKDGSTLGNTATLPDKPVGATTKPEWYDTLWGSVEAAGKKPKPKSKAPAPSEVIRPDDGEVAKDDGTDDAP